MTVPELMKSFLAGRPAGTVVAVDEFIDFLARYLSQATFTNESGRQQRMLDLADGKLWLQEIGAFARVQKFAADKKPELPDLVGKKMHGRLLQMK